jgi:hypothetical protein
MLKKSISEEFLRSQDPNLLTPLLKGDSKSYATVMMYKSLEQMNASDEMKNALAKIVEDAKLKFPGFTFNQVPYYWLLKSSKAKNNTINIIDEAGKNIPILIIRQHKDGGIHIGYDYINLENGQLVYARSPEAIKSISEGLSGLKSKNLQILTKLNRETQFLLRDTDSWARNERLANYERGDVSNLMPAIPMLKKCEDILEARIERLKGIVSYYKNQSESIVSKGSPEVFKSISSIIDQEIKKKGSKFIKTEQDAINALVMRYIGKPEEFKTNINSGALNDILPDPSGKIRHNVKDILSVALQIVQVIEAEAQRKRMVRTDYTKDRSESVNERQTLPDTERHPIFKPITAPITEESFKDLLPGDPKGFQHEGLWISEKYAIEINVNSIKLNAMEKMLEAVKNILGVLQLRRETKRLSVTNFTKNDISELKDALSSCMTLINSYKQSIITKDNKLNKNIVHSIFGDAAIDFFTARYIAVMIKYIEMVFVKSYKEAT